MAYSWLIDSQQIRHPASGEYCTEGMRIGGCARGWYAGGGVRVGEGMRGEYWPASEGWETNERARGYRDGCTCALSSAICVGVEHSAGLLFAERPTGF